MKKIYFIVAAAVVAFASCAPLRTVMNSTDRKGNRTVCTSDINFFDEFEIAMGYKTSQKDTLLALLVTCSKRSDHGLFERGDLLRIRFEDGQEMNLENIYDKEFDKKTKMETEVDSYIDTRMAYAYSPWMDSFYLTPVTVRQFVPRAYTRTTTKSFALYMLTRKQLEDILAKKAEKVRVEIENDDCDMAVPEIFSSKVKELYDYLKTVEPIKHSPF